MTHLNRYKTLIISIWIGNWPQYFTLFVRSISYNVDFNWLVVSDQQKCPYMADNMLFKSITSEDLSKLITEKLGFTVNISNPLKLCDLKPAFGHIFSDHLENYDYWGYCDLDLVTGNLKKYVHPLYEAGVDVISFYKSFLSGPLCLFKKSTHTLELYKKVQGYRAILMD
ncbi:hypothetical protein LCGC14_3098080, partial [marine sediment metagenome]